MDGGPCGNATLHTMSKSLVAALWPKIEIALAVVLLSLSLIHTGQIMGAMASTSLETDEFGTVLGYSSRGPVHVATHYRAPKNHILFNLANSLLPGRASLVPARARMLSILAVMAAAMALIGYGLYRRRLIESAFVLTLWTFAPQMLPLEMQARGYGFLGLAALVASIATIEYFRTDRRGWLIALAVAATLGTYTVPTFLFFAGPLMLLVWVARRSRETFIAGAAVCAAMLLLYAPVAGQVAGAFREFHAAGEMDFARVDGVFRSIKFHLFSSDDWQTFALFLGLVIAPFAILRRGDRESAGMAVTMGGVLAFLVIVLALRTPPIRTSAFVMVPLAIAGVFSLGELIRQMPLALWAAAFGVAGCLLTARVAPEIRAFRFTPDEDWLVAGKAVDATFPPSMKVDFKRYAKYLQHTMSDAGSREAAFDEDAYRRGALVVADAGNKWAEGRRFTRPVDEAGNAAITIPGGTRDIVLNFRPPLDRGLDAAPPALTDGSAATGINPSVRDVVIRTRSGADAFSLVFQLNHSAAPRMIEVAVSDAATGKKLEADAVWAGDAVIVPTPRQGGSTPQVEAKLESYDPAIEVVEAWAFPVSQP